MLEMTMDIRYLFRGRLYTYDRIFVPGLIIIHFDTLVDEHYYSAILHRVPRASLVVACD
jgi:hypothetical protein